LRIFERVAQARERLRLAGIAPDEADIDARVLAEFLLGWDSARYFTAGSDEEPDRFADLYRALVERRAQREPVAYIIGRQEFWDLTFEVSPAVLIPRPESELIVEVALERFPDPDAPLAIADACTGSGCLAIALAYERPAARVMATDLSEGALAIARRNAGRHGVAARIAFRRADVLDGVDGPFDLIVANPPYVPESDRSTLQPEVREHEPAIALFSGADGLDLIRRLIAQAVPRLKPGGTLIFEFGFGQSDAVAELISATAGLRMVALRPDLQGIPRTAVAKHVST